MFVMPGKAGISAGFQITVTPDPSTSSGQAWSGVHLQTGRWRAGGCRNRSGMTVLGMGAGGIRLRPRPSGSQQSITLLGALRRGDELGLGAGGWIAGACFPWLEAS
jgi:hypothetical protein